MQLTNEMVEQHRKYILYEAMRFPLHIRDDLMQEGYYGLLKAAQKYDPNRGVKLISYAIFYIKEYIYAYAKKNLFDYEELTENSAIQETDYISDISLLQLQSRVPEAIEILDDRQKDIIVSRYVDEKPTYLHVLGEKYGISEERTRQIEVASLLKMRNYLEK